MPVFCDEKLKQFQLDTKSSSYVMKVRDGFLLHLYWGSRLDVRDHSYMLWDQGRAAFSCRLEGCDGPILDDMRLEYPAWGRGDNRTPALEVINPDGSDIADLRYVSYRITDGKPMPDGLPAMYCEPDDGVQTLEIILRDPVSGLSVSLFYSVFPDTDIITRRALITNGSKDTLKLETALSAAIDFDRCDFDVISNHGTHCRERHVERAPLARGKFELYSRRGASSHVHNPFLILTNRDTCETAGEAFGLVLVYSGSFTASVEGTQYGAARLLAGINPDGFGWTLEPGEAFSTPEAVLCRADDGLDGLSYRFHRAFRERLCRGKFRDARRPVLLNMWEACYFGFDEARIKRIAECSADLGVELLVIDDGWFGKRDTDNCSLGDWTVDRRKGPGGIEAV